MISTSRANTSTDLQNFDLEDLVHLEQTFYNVGYEDGYKHGRLHGLIEGRALGAEKGFELWEELGFYEGAARFWATIATTDASGTDARGAHHASALLSLIDRFPRKNPRPDGEGVDMSSQLRLIRSRYKTMCASLGVRARLQPTLSSGTGTTEDSPDGTTEGAAGPAAAAGVRDPDADSGAEKRGKKTVWSFAGPHVASASPQGLSF